MVQIASSSPPSGILWLFLHHSCPLLSDAGFHILALHVSMDKFKKYSIIILSIVKCSHPGIVSSGTEQFSSQTATGSEKGFVPKRSNYCAGEPTCLMPQIK